MDAKDVTAFGLSLDVAGAILLARGLMAKSIIDIYDEMTVRF